MSNAETRNRETKNKLDAMHPDLSERARDMIANTEYRIIHEVFGSCDTAESVELLVAEIEEIYGDTYE